VLLACARERAELRGEDLDLATGRLPPAVPASRFRPASDRYADNWAAPPRPWDEAADGSAGTAALQARLAHLGPAEQVVFTLRDVEGWSAPEVAAALGLEERRVRSLANLARSRLRAALEERLAPEVAS